MIHLIGAGGHCSVVLDALLECGVDLGGIRVRDGNVRMAGLQLLGVSVETPDISPALAGHSFHIAIGSAAIRRRLYAEGEAVGGRALSVLHPRACISRFSSVGAGSLVAAMAIVGPGARLGHGVIVNHGAVVDHDCEVDDFTHLAPNCSLGGGVRIGARTLIGAGAAILPGVSVGDDVTVGAGAVVTRDIGSNQTWTGIPAVPKAT